MDYAHFLKNKVCIVTGAGKGIGLAIVDRFLQAGAVVYANVRNADSEHEGLKKLIPVFPNLHVQYFDVTHADEVKNAILDIKKNEGRVDVLVNNAGIVSYELLGLVHFGNFQKMWDTNVTAVIRLTQMVSKFMTRQKGGSIINISSIVGVKGVKGQLSYSATKGAVNAITLSAAKELSEFNIRVNAIAPGMVGTERLNAVMQAKFGDRIQDIGFGRLAEPREVADLCLFLASDLSSYVTGQIIGIDGNTII